MNHPDDLTGDLTGDEAGDETGGLPEGGARDLDDATAQLRERPSTLPVTVADRVLQRALATPRPAELVRAHPPHDFLKVSTVALVGLLRRRLDGELSGAALRRVLCVVSRDERLEEVTLELVVRYGVVVPEVAEQARSLGREVLRQALGPAADSASVTVQHVHVGDVTVGDPRLVDPADEEA